MSAIDVVKAGMHAVEVGDLATLASLADDNMVFEGPVPEPLGKDAFLGVQSALHAALPDWKFNTNELVEDGDHVHAVVAISGTHTGTLNLPMLPGPVAPTGKKVQLPQERIDYTTQNGKLTRISTSNTPGGGVMGILQQIGVQMPGM